MPKIVNAGLEAKDKAWTYEAKAIKIGVKASWGHGLASRTTSLVAYRGEAGIVITNVCMCLCVRLSAKLLADSQTQWMQPTVACAIIEKFNPNA